MNLAGPQNQGSLDSVADDASVMVSLKEPEPPRWAGWLFKQLPNAMPRVLGLEKSVTVVWDAATGERLAAVNGPPTPHQWLSNRGVSAVGLQIERFRNYALNRATLVTQEDDGSYHVWDVPPARRWPLFLALVAGQITLVAAFSAWRRRAGSRQRPEPFAQGDCRPKVETLGALTRPRSPVFADGAGAFITRK
jgi:hypothetical protein